jgi:hypothetical protein
LRAHARHSRQGQRLLGIAATALGQEINMTAYRITERDQRFIIGTDREAVLICRSLEVAHQAIADAELLETQSAKLIFSRRVLREESGGFCDPLRRISRA